ncbi:MAG: FAD-dependent monooxygenase [Actinomycetota bacterium]
MTVDVPVLIVGAGPVGLMAGLLLDQQGIDFRIVERRPTLHLAPQAHVISSRSLEICRSVGIDHETVRQHGPNPADTSSIRWVDRLVGRDLGVFQIGAARSTIERMLTQSPTPTANLGQDRFEAVLFDHLERPERVLFGHAWDHYELTEGGYRSTVRTDGNGGTVEISSRHLIGADGAGSRVRKALGIEMIGPDNLQTYLNIHFRANLRDELRGREGLLYWVMDHEAAGAFIAHDIESNWIFMKTVDDEATLNPIDEEHYADLLRRAVGAEVDVDIISMSPWRMTAQIAERYRRDGVFLVGDAAHRFPPTGGIGMNTGLQDVHNLVWKLAMVERGASASLLDTYEPERKPVAEVNSSQSMTNATKMFEVAARIDADGDGMISAADIEAVVDDPDRKAEVQAAVDDQAAHFNMSGLDLGFCYPPGPLVVGDGDPPLSDDPVSVYVPSTTPGARLPHVALHRGGEQLSTLDLVRHDAFLVLAGRAASGFEPGTSVVPVVVAQVGPSGDLTPADDRFEDLFGAGETLIVRPDGHIAARLSGDASAEAVAEVIDVVGAAWFTS